MIKFFRKSTLAVDRCGLFHARKRRAQTALLLGLLLTLVTSADATVIRSFSTRYEANVEGEIYLTGNVNLHEGREVGGNNNDYSMQNVDVDSNPSTFNSSSADFSLPPGAEVLWAGLYWGADTENSTATNPPNLAQRDRVLFSTGGGYQTVVSQIPIDQNSGGYRYQAFAEVTNLVKPQTAGTTRTYTTANIQAVTGSGPSHYAGWSLVMVIRDPAEVLRHLHVFDGFVQIDSSTPTDTTTVTGFRTPLAGAFNTQVGMVAYEGDLDTNGDYFEVNGSRLSNALNSVGNFFNSSITRENSRVTSKNPDFVNQLGFDLDTVSVPYTSGIIANGDTSADLTFAMTGDWYYPGVLTFAIDIYDPVLQGNITKSMVDLNGGALYADDLIEFTIRVGNTGNDNAVDVVLTDPIPAGTSYEPGSLQIVSGPNAGAKSDSQDGDHAEYDSDNDRVVFRLGTGANGSTGGLVGIDQWTEIRFRVKVDADVSAGTSISNSAKVDFTGEVSGLDFSATSNIVDVIAELYSDLEVTKTIDSSFLVEGDTASYTVTILNNGPDGATNVAVTDQLPSGTLLQTATASQGTYNVGSGIWTVGDLANSASATLTLDILVDTGAAALAQPISNSASATADQVDPEPADNSASADFTAGFASDLSASTKTVVDLNGGEVEPGDVLRYSINVMESAGLAANNVQVTDDIPANVTGFTVTDAAGGTDHSSSTGGSNGTGFLDVRDIVLPVSGSVTIVFEVTVTGTAGATIDNTATIVNPFGPGATPSAPQLTVLESATAPTGIKPLYLQENFHLSRVPTTSNGSENIDENDSETWTLNPPAAADTTIDPAVNSTVPVYLVLRRDNRNGNRTVQVDLQCSSGGPVLTETRTVYLNNTRQEVQFNLSASTPPWTAPITCPEGEAWELTVTNTDDDNDNRMYVFLARAEGTSRVELPATTVINVDDLRIYDSAYPGGNPLSSAAPGQTVRVRATVSDPFGSFDIAGADLTLTNPSAAIRINGASMTEVHDDSAARKIYEYAYTIPTGDPVGTWSAEVTADEGTEGTVSDNASTTFTTEPPSDLSSSTKAWFDLNGGDQNPGDVIRYTLSLRESAGTAASGVSVTDVLDSNLTWSGLQSCPAGATCSYASGQFNASGINIPANGSVDLVFDVTIASGASSGTIINNIAAVLNPDGLGANPETNPPITVSASSIPGSGNKPLYLYDGTSSPAYKLSRIPPAGAQNPNTLQYNEQQAWDLNPALQMPVTLDSTISGSVPVELYLARNDSWWSGSSREFTVSLQCTFGGTVISQSFSRNLATTPTLQNFSLALDADLTCPAGDTWSLTIENTTEPTTIYIWTLPNNIGVFPVYNGNPSQVILPSKNVINVDGIAFRDTSGNPLASVAPGGTIRIRATVSDPFGHADITAGRIDLTDTAGNAVVTGDTMTEVASSGAEKIYEFQYTMPADSPTGNWTVRVEADEGTEGTVSDFALAALQIGGPDITLVKTVQTYSDPVNGTSNPYAIPGAVMRYTLMTTNTGAGATDADSVILTDEIPAQTDLVVSGSPVVFINGATASGLTFNAATDVSYYNAADNPVSPTADGNNVDPTVRKIVVTPQGSLLGSDGVNHPSFSIIFNVRVR